jgi:hypothetical protein
VACCHDLRKQYTLLCTASIAKLHACDGNKLRNAPMAVAFTATCNTLGVLSVVEIYRRVGRLRTARGRLLQTPIGRGAPADRRPRRGILFAIAIWASKTVLFCCCRHCCAWNLSGGTVERARAVDTNDYSVVIIMCYIYKAVPVRRGCTV